jgi:hypothetical protein
MVRFKFSLNVDQLPIITNPPFDFGFIRVNDKLGACIERIVVRKVLGCTYSSLSLTSYCH